MEKEIYNGTIKEISEKGVSVLMDGDENETLFHKEYNGVFKEYIVGDKVILESVIENNSMTLNVSKKEEPTLVATNRTGVGKSYWKENLMKNSFVIDTTQETEESFIEKLKEAKNQKEKVLVVGGAFLGCTPMITSFLQSGLHATVIVDDIQDIGRGIVTPKLNDIDFLKHNFKRDIDLTLTAANIPEPIKPDSKKYDYCHGKQPELSFKSGGNNRKIKKRKKAKNGKSKK